MQSFEGQNQSFDLLIFDEASQVELQDAATCLLKGRSIVVAGDEHQMPPSQYFKVAVDHLFEEDDEDENEGANIEVESLLEFCQQQPHFTLDFWISTTGHTIHTSFNFQTRPSTPAW